MATHELKTITTSIPDITMSSQTKRPTSMVRACLAGLNR